MRVVQGGAESNAVPLEVTLRPAPSNRIRWRFTLDSDYTETRAAVGADGTVYVNDVGGNLYALTPDGALKWIYKAGLLGSYGAVSIGADGTLYVASLVPKPDGTLGNVGGIHAINPDGTEKWVFKQTGGLIIAGPSVGPDGNIYCVARGNSAIGLFALSPAGTLLFKRGTHFEAFGMERGQEIVFGKNGQFYYGFNFWLGKLEDNGGDYVRAEMVKAFITSDEYLRRFSP